MISFSKLVALAILASGTALISSSSPSTAQTDASICCTPGTVVGVTNATWKLTGPAGGPNAVVITPPSTAWSTITGFAGIKWIGPTAGSGTGTLAGGPYVYSKSFCLCPANPAAPNAPVAATLTLQVLADNNFTVWLNGTQIGQSPGYPTNVVAFKKQTTITTTKYFKTCQNTIAIKVVNQPSSPTGLEASATLSGMVAKANADGVCPCTTVRPRPVPLPNIKL